MNDNAKKWVAALRSGKYKQTRGVLNSPDGGYCCLGVACELAIENGLEIEVERIPCRPVQYDGRYSLLPNAVRDWLGLATSGGGYASGSLTSRNDSGYPFESIADIIESEPEGLFEDER